MYGGRDPKGELCNKVCTRVCKYEPDPSKVSAITKMPWPEDKTGVQCFLGMCHRYLSKFCPNLTTSVLPLCELTKQDSAFTWSNTHKSVFHAAKEQLLI